MKNSSAALVGAMLTVTTGLAIKVAYKFGRYSAIRDIYKNGCVVAVKDEETEKED